MTKLLALLALVVLLWMALRRARLFLASPRGQELRAVWNLLRQISGATAGRGATSGRGGNAGGGTSSHTTAPAGAGGRARPGDTSPIALVRCSVCGTHVPEVSARRRKSGVYCSDACEQRATP